jgi:serine O-acetyltransferase
VVGIPGRLAGGETERRSDREETARRLGFDAYGQVKDLNDPLVQAVDVLLDHAKGLETQLTLLAEALCRHGINVNLPDIPSCEELHRRQAK